MEEESGQPDGLARRDPGGPEVADRAPVAMKHVGAFGDPERPPPRHEREEVPREHERQRLLVLRDGAWKTHAPAGDGAVLDAEREPGPLRAECVPATQTREISELGGVGDLGRFACAEFLEEPGEFWGIDEALTHVVLS